MAGDPSGNAYGLYALFHGSGASGFYCLLEGNAVPVACKSCFLYAGTEECGKEERWGRRCSSLAAPIEAFKICVHDRHVVAAFTEPLTETGEKGGKESAYVQEIKDRSRRAQQEEFQNLFVEPCR